jgi:hypothetical protein
MSLINHPPGETIEKIETKIFRRARRVAVV